MAMTSEELFAEVNRICQYRFKYSFKESNFHQLEFCKTETSVVSLLREIAKSTGLVFRVKDYDFRTGQSYNSKKLPIEDIDVIDFEHRIKNSEIYFSETRKNIEIG